VVIVWEVPVLKGEDATDAVCTAVALGWQVARLSARLNGSTTTTSGGGDDQRRRALQIGVSITRLAPVLADTGLDALDASKLKEVSDDPAAVVATFDKDVSDTLSAADFRVGKAYSVGRMLSQLHDSTGSKTDLEAPLVALRARLQDLRSVLKPHAAKGVIDSIDYWRVWAAGDGQKPSKQANASSDTTQSALARQVHRWRGVLSGERDAADLLSAGAFVTAGRGLMKAYAQLGWACLRRWWPLIGLVGLAVVGIAVPLAIWGRNSNSGVAALIVTVLTGLGITGKSLTATLSKALKGVEDDLENAELDAAIGLAATTLPGGATPDRAMLERVPAPPSPTVPPTPTVPSLPAAAA
jgi:hypothetical protein